MVPEETPHLVPREGRVPWKLRNALPEEAPTGERGGWGLERDPTSDPEPEPVLAPEPPNRPIGPRHTVCIRNAPYAAPLVDVLDIVQFGPIYHIRDSMQDDRVISLTFFEAATALAFYRDAKANEVEIYGRSLRFSWGRGPTPIPSTPDAPRSRAITITDQGQLGTEKALIHRLEAYGPVDSVTLMREEGRDRAFVNFLSVYDSIRAARALSYAGADVEFVPDRCCVAGNAKALALDRGSRSVMLRNIPPDTTLSEICDQVRGGAIYRIGLSPESGIAFIHFVEHSSAMSFHRYALYKGVMIRHQRINPVFMGQSKPIPRFIFDHLDRGATRCVGIEGILNEDMLRADCVHYGNIERITFTKTQSIVAFAAIPHAITTLRLLPTKLAYRGLEITFVEDPCATAYKKDLEKATALHAEISSMLLPTQTQRKNPRIQA
ncbi:hypothetical protein C8R46DRAFT_1029025 [Mycena filopes]|nr:hypothetical protein C8R46DRAFT_1029025 [Mycena filopes]